MTSRKKLQQIMNDIWRIQLKATALGWDSRQTYEAYKHLLPSEVTMIDFPFGNLNCAGYALDLGRTTSEPWFYLDRGYDEVSFATRGGVYILYHEKDWIHMGKVISSERGISKWGWTDPIFEHPIDFYPGPWEVCRFFKRENLFR
ncbi:MAG: hypothetical protein HYW23_01675 [Candidatus Aenigmarchaeota archaeon]|nr:hypothetical protein [Candidatus Aenigmarchaeota archaeon]